MSQDLTSVDTKHLQELYGEDKEILSIIFESFLEDSLVIWNQIGTLIDTGNFVEAGQKIHQIKPNFSMVGLTGIYPLIQEFEKIVKDSEGSDKPGLKAAYDNLDAKVQAGSDSIKEKMDAL